MLSINSVKFVSVKFIELYLKVSCCRHTVIDGICRHVHQQYPQLCVHSSVFAVKSQTTCKPKPLFRASATLFLIPQAKTLRDSGDYFFTTNNLRRSSWWWRQHWNVGNFHQTTRRNNPEDGNVLVMEAVSDNGDSWTLADTFNDAILFPVYK
jgi:hypothetical protein